MNKAFVRELDAPEPRCPGCGTLGQAVGRATLEAHLPPDLLALLAGSAWYCANPTCSVAYYDSAGQTAGVEQARGRAYPKDPAGPVCSCFGVTAEQIASAARARRAALIHDLIAKAQSREADCATLAPSGCCCIPQVQRLFRQFSPPPANVAKP